MKKIFYIVIIICFIFLLVGCESNKNEKDSINQEQTKIQNNSSNNAKFLDDLYGVYGDMYDEQVLVFPCDDKNYVDIEYSAYRLENFKIKNVKLTKNENGVVEGYKIISETDNIAMNDIDDEDNIRMDVLINNGNITLKFNEKVLYYADSDANTVINLKSDNTKVIDEKEKENALNLLKTNNFNNINSDIFEVVNDSNNYISLRVKCYIYQNNNDYKTYVMEGSDSAGMFKYYNFSKKTKKLLSIDDLLKSSEDKEILNRYIRSVIDKEKNNSGDNWKYEEFVGIGEKNDFENYFLIDENKKTIKIRCLPYPNEATIGIGDFCVDVPFSIFKNV